MSGVFSEQQGGGNESRSISPKPGGLLQSAKTWSMMQ